MDTAAPLDGLREIQLPDPAGWWPPAPGWWLPAPGWWLLAGLGLILLAWLVRRLYRRWAGQAFKRQARQALRGLRRDWQAHRDAGRLARELSVLLRRAALAAYPRAEVAGLHGDAWLAFLDRHAQSHAFSEGPGRALADAPYRRQAEVDGEALLGAAEDWIRRL